MAYVKNIWKDRNVEFPRRFKKSGETSTEVTLTADPGVVTEAGTPVNAALLNRLEVGLENVKQLHQITADSGSVINMGTSDANLLNKTGMYSIFSNSANLPAATDLYIQVYMYSATYIQQIAYNFGGGGVWFRNCVNGVWSSWSKNIFDFQTYKLTDGVGSALLLPAAYDLNNVVSTGFYRGEALSNSPSVGWVYVEVIAHDPSYVVQQAYNFYDARYSWRRIRSAGVWSKWVHTYPLSYDGEVGTTTVFVNASTGNDANDGLSFATPKRTLAAGIAALPRVSGKNRELRLMGAFSEALRFDDFVGGAISVYAADNTTTSASVSSIYFENCVCRIDISYITIVSNTYYGIKTVDVTSCISISQVVIAASAAYMQSGITIDGSVQGEISFVTFQGTGSQGTAVDIAAAGPFDINKLTVPNVFSIGVSNYASIVFLSLTGISAASPSVKVRNGQTFTW